MSEPCKWPLGDEPCEREATHRSYCDAHYKRAYDGFADDIEYLADLVDADEL